MIVYLIAGQGERDAIAALLTEQALEIKAFEDVASFLAQAGRSQIGCILVDLQHAGVAAMRQLRPAPNALPVIVLSSQADVQLAVAAMKEGAADFLQKPIDAENLRASIHAAQDACRARVENARRKQELLVRYRSLSARERDVVDAVLHGRANREVASQLGIKLRTVEVHRSNAMCKLGARTLPDLVRIWLDVDATVARLNAE